MKPKPSLPDHIVARTFLFAATSVNLPRYAAVRPVRRAVRFLLANEA